MSTELKSTNTIWERFAHALLATTCLAGAGGVASATTVIVVEGSIPGGDFANTSPGYVLPFGTNEIQGSLTGTTDTKDWFEFDNLVAGEAFSLHGVYTPLHQEKGVTFQVFNSSHVQFGNSSLEGQGRPINGTTPQDGTIIVQVQFAQAGNPHYQFTLTDDYLIPEPSTGAGAGLALAGALAWRRKRAARS
jgi:PEP-CTERM motif